MPVELAELVSPWRTAIVTSEIQNGVIGDQAALPGPGRGRPRDMIPTSPAS